MSRKNATGRACSSDVPIWFAPEEFISKDGYDFLLSSDYILTMEIFQNVSNLCHILSEVRSRYGLPIIVNSGFRTPAHNLEVGGVPNSFHLFGRAADLRGERGFNSPAHLNFMEKLLRSFHPIELIRHPTYIHVAF